MRTARFVKDFSDAAHASVSVLEFKALIEDAAREIGFDHVAVLHSASLFRKSPQLIRYDNYPAGWERRLVARGYKVIDPVLSIARRRIAAFLWSDALSVGRLSESEVAILSEGARYGIRQGLTVPANVPGEPEGSVNFATYRDRAIGRDRILIAEAIGRIAFDVARNLAGVSHLRSLTPQLSPRVRECIYWIAHGKTDQDVADILGIGLETVRTYVKSAFQLLGVITRAQLVHEALRLGLIDPDPSIPPFG
jgi:LuxR family quorum-sensing system transcriptional regulator CciR